MAALFNIISKIFGNKYDKDIKDISPLIEEINNEFQDLNTISNDHLREKTLQFKEQIYSSYAQEEDKITKLNLKANNEESNKEKEIIYKQIDELNLEITKKIELELNNLLPKAFAVIKETARRFKEKEKVIVTANDNDKILASSKDFIKIESEKAVYETSWDAAGNNIVWDMIPYDVQLIGGVVLHQGKIAEMQTGEGKTLSATLPIYLNALTGRGVHLVTVNNYLAKRDSEWMGPLFQFHGLSVDCIDNHQPNSEERRQAYLADITYGTNNEFGFDYLRDNMAKRPGDLVQRKLNYSIVDEVDSVLVDDARTPLIISGPTPQGDKHEYNEFKHKVAQLVNVQKKICYICNIRCKKTI